MNAFLDEPRNAIVIGIRANGTPHATPNWFLWQGGRFYISTTKNRAKYRIFSNDPRVQLVIDDSTSFRYVIVDGTVEIDDDVESGLANFEQLRVKHGRTEQTRDELRNEMIRDQRVLLTVMPTRDQSTWPGLGWG